eukprot:scaffold3854_cov107-Isochrysis_galbana.AAC.2
MVSGHTLRLAHGRTAAIPVVAAGSQGARGELPDSAASAQLQLTANHHNRHSLKIKHAQGRYESGADQKLTRSRSSLLNISPSSSQVVHRKQVGLHGFGDPVRRIRRRAAHAEPSGVPGRVSHPPAALTPSCLEEPEHHVLAPMFDGLGEGRVAFEIGGGEVDAALVREQPAHGQVAARSGPVGGRAPLGVECVHTGLQPEIETEPPEHRLAPGPCTPVNDGVSVAGGRAGIGAVTDQPAGRVQMSARAKSVARGRTLPPLRA